ncbi:MAG TPA: hypothetical protein VFE32_02420 [Puia sp.]|jgi:WD40 repeat protein|nr:hypothetical protein [Puia sp.]
MFLPFGGRGQSHQDATDAKRIFDEAVALKNRGINYDLAVRKLRAVVTLDPDLERAADSVIIRITELEHEQQERAVMDKQLSDVRQLETLANSVGDRYPDRKILILLEALRRNKNEVSNEGALEQEVLRGLHSYYYSYRYQHAKLSDFEMSADENWLALCGEDSTVELYNRQGTNGNTYYLLPQTGKVRWMKFSADTQWLAVVTDPEPGPPFNARPRAAGHFILYNLQAPAQPDTQFSITGASVRSLTFSPEGHCALLLQDGTLKMYRQEAQKWRPIPFRKGSLNKIQSFTFREDGLAVAGDNQGRVAFWYPDSLMTPIEMTASFPDTVRSISFSPDSRWMVATFSRRTNDSSLGKFSMQAYLWLMADNRNVQYALNYPYGSSTSSPEVTFSLDSRWLTIVDHSNALRLWQLTNDPDTSRVGIYDIGFINEAVTVAKFSHDNQMLAFGTAGIGTPSGLVRICDLNNPTNSAATFNGHLEQITDLAFSPDDKKLYSASSDWTVRVWNPRNPETVPIVLKGQEGTVNKLYAGDGILLTGSIYRNLPNNESSESVRWYLLLPDHEPRPLENIGFVPEFSAFTRLSENDRWLGLTGNLSRYLLSLDSSNGYHLTKTQGWPIHQADAILSPHGKWMITEDPASLKLELVDSGITIDFPLAFNRRLAPMDYCFNESENALAFAITWHEIWLLQPVDNSHLGITDTIRLQEFRHSGVAHGGPGLHFNNAGNRLLITDSVALLYEISRDGRAGVSIPLATEGENIAAASIAGNRFFLASLRGAIFTGKLDGIGQPVLKRIDINQKLTNISLITSPDNRWLVISGGGNCYLWKTDGSLAKPIAVEVRGEVEDRSVVNSVKQVEFSRDSKWLSVILRARVVSGITLGDYYSVNLIDVSGSTLKKYLIKPDKSRYGYGTISPDGKWFAALKILPTNVQASGTDVALYRLDGSKLNQKPELLNVQDHTTVQIAFSRDSKFIYTCAMDRSIVKWNLQTRRPVFIQDPDHLLIGPATSEAYPLASNNTLITVNKYYARDTSERQHTLINYYNFDIDYIKKLARNIVGRNLSPEEWRKYFPDAPYRKVFEDLP